MPDSQPQRFRKPILGGTDVQGRSIQVYVHPQINEMDRGFAIIVTRDNGGDDDTFPIDLQADEEQARLIFGLLAARLYTPPRGFEYD